MATPDHTHAVIAAAAMKRGKHVYVEKPTAHDVAQARVLRHIARQQKVASQMSNQGMATDSFPLLPGFKAASIWMRRPVPKKVIRADSMRDTIPSVTEICSPPTGYP